MARTWALIVALAVCRPAAAGTPDNQSSVVFFDSAGGGAAFDFWGLFKRFRKSETPLPAAAPPGPVFRIVSWNLQTFGAHMKAARKEAAAAALAQIFSDPSAKVLAAQEIANERGAAAVQSMLDAGDSRWAKSFDDSEDGQDNGFFVKEGVHINCGRPLFGDRSLSRHPARFSHMRVGDFDFTLITVHLAYDKGQASSSAAELRQILDWLREHLAKPGADPDVIVLGDFNLPTRRGKAGSARGESGSWTAIEEVIEEYPLFRGGNLVALVDEPTSRFLGEAANNYDHLIVTGHLFHGAYVADSARRMPTELFKAIEAAHNVQVSDHYPISAEFRSSGPGADGRPIRPDGAGACAR